MAAWHLCSETPGGFMLFEAGRLWRISYDFRSHGFFFCGVYSDDIAIKKQQCALTCSKKSYIPFMARMIDGTNPAYRLIN